MRRFAALLAAALLAATVLATTAAAATGAPQRGPAIVPKDTGQTWCQSHAHLGVIGDSISSGWALDHGAADAPTDPNIWFYDVVDQMGSTPDNQAVAGTSTADYITGGQYAARTQTIAAEQDNMVFVALGTNDWLSGRTPATYQANLIAIYNTIRAASPAAAIVFVTPYDTSAYHTTTYGWGAYITAAYQAAVATGAALIEMSQVVPADGQAAAAGLYNADNTHLTLAGQRVMGAYALGRVLTICG